MLIDMHSHILPKCDHGSDSVETSIKQVKKAVELGIDTILCTPHYYQHQDNVKDFLARREKCYNDLMDALDEETKSKVRFILGAEVTLEVDLDKEPDLRELCIGDTNNILIEMPKIRWSDWTYNALYNISSKYRVSPIIAHIDRYEEKNTTKVYEMGYNIQVNASAFTTFSQRRKFVKKFREGKVHLLGSDVHGPAAIEYDMYAKALKSLDKYKDEIMDNAKNILGI